MEICQFFPFAAIYPLSEIKCLYFCRRTMHSAAALLAAYEVYGCTGCQACLAEQVLMTKLVLGIMLGNWGGISEIGTRIILRVYCILGAMKYD